MFLSRCPVINLLISDLCPVMTMYCCFCYVRWFVRAYRMGVGGMFLPRGSFKWNLTRIYASHARFGDTHENLWTVSPTNATLVCTEELSFTNFENKIASVLTWHGKKLYELLGGTRYEFFTSKSSYQTLNLQKWALCLIILYNTAYIKNKNTYFLSEVYFYQIHAKYLTSFHIRYCILIIRNQL